MYWIRVAVGRRFCFNPRAHAGRDPRGAGSDSGRRRFHRITDAGRQKAVEIGRYLAGQSFALVLTSPLRRAHYTCRLAGFGDSAEIDSNLHEWEYGDTNPGRIL